MKTYRNLWPRLCDFENLYYAWIDARRGKSTKLQVLRFEADLEGNLCSLLDELVDGTYRPRPYTNFYIYEKKRRKISAADLRDRIVHHAYCNVVEPIFERRFIQDSYACRVGKGTHRALDRCTYFARRYRFVLKCDVAKFFPTVDHEILLAILARLVRDPRVMRLSRTILASGEGILNEEAPQRWFPGDDLFAVLRPKGLPIGNLTSQFWANVYLNELDQYVKRRLGVPGYLRYADDFLLFSNSKYQLWQWQAAVIGKLADLRLWPNTRSFYVAPVGDGVEFLGFRVYPDHRRLLPENVRRARRRFRWLGHQFSLGRIDARRVRASIQAWIAHAVHGDTWGLRRAVLREFRGCRRRNARVPDLRQDGPDVDLANDLHGEVPQIPSLPDGETA